MAIMQTSTKISVWLILITFALVFYGMGAASVKSFVNYPTWPLIGANEFRAYHRLHGHSDARRDHIDNSPPLVSTSIAAYLRLVRPE
jgi:hypothetical protein